MKMIIFDTLRRARIIYIIQIKSISQQRNQIEYEKILFYKFNKNQRKLDFIFCKTIN